MRNNRLIRKTKNLQKKMMKMITV